MLSVKMTADNVVPPLWQTVNVLLASCLIYARALLEYVIFISWVRSFSKMLLSGEIRGR